MGKFMTKLLSAFLCIAFTGLQMSFADVLQTGMFANKDVLTGAQIKGHTAGLTKIDTDAALNNATLHFNANTRIDWNKLNVYKDQTLTFKNGNFGVLNNVVGTSISKFAGTIKADSGKIVIANPNGILFEGGKFESLGGLVLTTKNLTGLNIDESTDFNSLDIENAAWDDHGDDITIVAITNSSNISAADINIISQGIYIDDATLASSNSNGIVLSTSDGSTFQAHHVMTADDGTVSNIDFTGNYSITVANSAITTNDGTLKLVSGKDILLSNYNVTGNIDAKANGAVAVKGKDAGLITGDAKFVSETGRIDIYDTTVNGSLTANAAGTVYAEAVVDGDADLTGGSVQLYFTTIKGNANLTGTKSDEPCIVICYSDLLGDTTAVGKNLHHFFSTTNTFTGEFIDYAMIKSATMGDTKITNAGWTRIYGNTQVNGDLTLDTFSLNLGFYQTNSDLTEGTLDVTGNLTANVESTVGYSDVITAKSINITSQNSSILVAESKTANGKLIADNITLKAENGNILSLNGNRVDNKISDYFTYMQAGDMTTEKWDALGDSVYRGGLDIAGGSADIISKGSVFLDANLTGDLTVTTQNVADVAGTIGNDLTIDASTTAYLRNADVGGDANITSGCIGITNSSISGNGTFTDTTANEFGIRIAGSNVDGNLKVDTKDWSSLSDVTAGKTDITSESYIRLMDVELGETTLSSNSDFVRIGGDSVFDGNLTIDAFSLNLGYYDTNAVLKPGSITVNGTLDADTYSTIGYSSTVRADKIDLNSSNSSIFQAVSDNVTGELVSDNVVLTANKGYIAALDGNAKDGTSEYFKAMNTLVSVQNFKDITGKDIMDCGPINISSATENGNLDVTIDTSVINIKTDAGSTNVNVVPDSITNIIVESTGDITAEDITIVKDANDTSDKTGNAEFTSSNGSITINNITADNDIDATAKDTITAGGLVADADNNGVGDITLKADNIVNLDDSTANNITIESGNGTNITNSEAKDDITITAGGNVIADTIIADADNNGVGDITINGEKDVTLDNSSAENITIDSGNDTNITNSNAKDDIDITAGGNVIADTIIADADNDGVGDITINGEKDVTLDNSSAENITIESGNDTNISNSDAKDDIDITAGGNVIADTIIADADNDGIGDITINGEKDVTLDNSSAENITIDSGNDTNISNSEAKDDITITAGGNVDADKIIADADNDGVGDITINGDKDVSLDDSSADNITIESGNDTNISNSDAKDDIDITAGGNVDADNITADSNDDGVGDINIHGDKDVNLDDSSANNITTESGNDTNINNTEAKDDINITAGNDVTGDKVIADSNDDGIGDLNVNAGGDVDLNNSHGNKIDINAGGSVSIKDSTSNNGIYYNGIKIGNTLSEEVIKFLNNLQQSGVNTAMAQSFTPIAFAASDDDDEQSELAKKIAKTVFRNEDGSISITDRFDTLK